MSEPKVKAKRVLFFDSGVGGLSVYKAVKALNPDVEAYYLFDNECFPYGNKGDHFLIKRIEALLEKASKIFDLSAIVVACNTASTVALPELRLNIKLPIVGVVPAVKPAAKLSKNKIIGVLATPGCLSREYTNNLIKTFASDCKVIKVGDAHLAEIEKIIKPFTSLSKDERPDTIVLGCTHYPFVKDVLEELLPEVRYVDSGEAIGRRVKDVVKEAKYIETERIQNKAFYTGVLKNYTDREKMVKEFGFVSLEKFEL